VCHAAQWCSRSRFWWRVFALSDGLRAWRNQPQQRKDHESNISVLLNTSYITDADQPDHVSRLLQQEPAGLGVVMQDTTNDIKGLLFSVGLILLSLAFVFDWRLVPACIVGWLFSWFCAHLCYWYEEIFDPYDVEWN
jgi:hypothetical protein